MLAALAEIFDFFLLNINYSGLVVIFQHILYKSQSLTEINTIIKIVSALLSTFSLSIIGWSANLIRSRKEKTTDFIKQGVVIIYFHYKAIDFLK